MGEGKQSLNYFGFALKADDSLRVEEGCLGSQVSVAGTGMCPGETEPLPPQSLLCGGIPEEGKPRMVPNEPRVFSLLASRSVDEGGCDLPSLVLCISFL